jgi:hypothetical protein
MIHDPVVGQLFYNPGPFMRMIGRITSVNPAGCKFDVVLPMRRGETYNKSSKYWNDSDFASMLVPVETSKHRIIRDVLS